MKLYKFIEKRWMDDLFENGSLRIGTLYDYNKENKYNSKVSDPRDGIKKIQGTINSEYSKIGEANIDPVVSSIFEFPKDGENIVFENVTINNLHEKSQNLFIFSTAYTYSFKLHQEWLREGNYDACYEIFNPVGFFKAISIEIQNSYIYRNYHRIHYTDNIDINSDFLKFHPALIKERKYKGQYEMRAIWEQKGPVKKIDIDHRIVKIKNPHLYCRPLITIEH